LLNTTTSMRLQITQAHKQEISYAQGHKQETSNAQAQLQETYNQIDLAENCLSLNTWYTISGVHNTNQLQTLKTLETIEFLKYGLCLRNYKWLWNANNNRVWTLNCCESRDFVCVCIDEQNRKCTVLPK